MSGFDASPVLARFGPGVPSGEIADRLGVCGASVRYWRAGRRISPPVADRVAVALGLHPLNLWPTWPDLPKEAA